MDRPIAVRLSTARQRRVALLPRTAFDLLVRKVKDKTGRDERPYEACAQSPVKKDAVPQQEIATLDRKRAADVQDCAKLTRGVHVYLLTIRCG